MKRALTLATGLTIGYVAGTRAGRERYEQMKGKLHEAAQQPAVAEMRENVQSQVGAATKAVTNKVTHKITDTVSKVSKNVRDHADDDSEPGRHDTAKVGEYPAAPTGVVPGGGGA